MIDHKLPTLHEIRGDILAELNSDEPNKEKLDVLLPQLNQKIENYSAFYKNKQAEKKILQASIDIYKDKIKDLEVDQSSIDKQCDWLASEAKRSMEELEQHNVETPLHKVRIQENPPKVVIENIDAIDPIWINIQEKAVLDKKGMIDNYKETGEIPTGVDIVKQKKVVFT